NRGRESEHDAGAGVDVDDQRGCACADACGAHRRRGTHRLNARRTLVPPRQSLRWLGDRKSTRLNSSHVEISYAVFCLKKKKMNETEVRFTDDNTLIRAANPSTRRFKNLRAHTAHTPLCC